jgi:hypothetical protein
MKLSPIFMTLVGACAAHADLPWDERSQPVTQEDSEKPVLATGEKLLENLTQEEIEEWQPVTQEEIEKSIQIASIARPHRPIDGEPRPDRSGVLFGDEWIYFYNIYTKCMIVEALTGQNNNLDLDVTQHLLVTKENFANAEVTLKSTLKSNFGTLNVYLLKIRPEGPALRLHQFGLIVLLKKLGDALGLSANESSEIINSLLKSASHQVIGSAGQL